MSILLLFLSLFQSTPSVYSLADSLVAYDVWTRSGGTGKFCGRCDWSVIYDDSNAYLLRNGTQEQIIDPATARLLRPTLEQQTLTDVSSTPALPIWQERWPKSSQWQKWLEAPSGFDAQWNSQISRSPGSPPLNRMHGLLQYTHPLRNWAWVGGGLAWEGTITRLKVPWLPRGGFGGANLSALVSACLPGICLESQQSESPLPEWTWLEPDLDSLSATRSAGSFLRSFHRQSLSDNWTHRLRLRLGALRYRMHWDADAYSGTVQEIALRDLEAGFGTWGLSLLWNRHRAAPGFEMDFFPKRWGWGNPNWFLNMVPVHVEFRSVNYNHYLASLSLLFHLDAPFSRTPLTP